MCRTPSSKKHSMLSFELRDDMLSKTGIRSSVRPTARVRVPAPDAFPASRTHADLPRAHSTEPLAVNGRMNAGTTSLYRFPHSNFKYFLTLFSKFFSSFPHGTCSLSVSHPYLALDGIYHQIRAAFPSNSTLWTRIMDDSARNERRDSHPL